MLLVVFIIIVLFILLLLLLLSNKSIETFNTCREPLNKIILRKNLAKDILNLSNNITTNLNNFKNKSSAKINLDKSTLSPDTDAYKALQTAYNMSPEKIIYDNILSLDNRIKNLYMYVNTDYVLADTACV
jgi:hypothetical protein